MAATFDGKCVVRDKVEHGTGGLWKKTRAGHQCVHPSVIDCSHPQTQLVQTSAECRISPGREEVEFPPLSTKQLFYCLDFQSQLSWHVKIRKEEEEDSSHLRYVSAGFTSCLLGAPSKTKKIRKNAFVYVSIVFCLERRRDSTYSKMWCRLIYRRLHFDTFYMGL